MKGSVRPLFSMLLLMVMAATLSFRVAIRRGTILLQNNPPFTEKSTISIYNETLLKFASVDVGEPRLKQEIEQLMEGNFGSSARHRSFLSSRRYSIDIRARSARGMPVQLRSPQFYRMWLDFRRHLRDWSRNRRFESESMLNLMNSVKGSIDRYTGEMGLDRKYRSCAVVGNSGILLKKEYGDLIDSNDLVIRLNNARTSSFERNVGKKTSISFVNSNILHSCARREGCFCHPYGVTVPTIMYICQPVHFLDYLLCNSSHKSPLLITDPGFDVLCGRIVKYYSMKRFMEETGKGVEEWGSVHDGPNFHYSSGMQAIMLALGICEKVSVFGFGKSDSAKHHYHTNQKAELKLHDYVAEYDLYWDLMKRPQISLEEKGSKNCGKNFIQKLKIEELGVD